MFVFPFRFRELESHIPEDVKNDWYFETILDRISQYGQVRVPANPRAPEPCCFQIFPSPNFCQIWVQVFHLSYLELF